MSRQDWRTLPTYFRLLNQRFGPFELDAAADDENHLCARWYTERDNALVQSWAPRTFVNIPFDDPPPWIDKAAAEQQFGRVTTMIAVANVSSRWFHRALNHAQVWLPDKRISFWHPDEDPGSFDRDTLVLHFGEPANAGKVSVLHVHEGMNREVRELHMQANRRSA